MFLTQIIGCITGALVVAVLWLGVELHGVRRDAEWRDGVRGEDIRQLDACVAELYDMVEGRDDTEAR